MIFNSLQFALFFAVVLVAYWQLRHRGQNLLLLAASYVFYGWWDYRLLALLVGVTVAAFLTARAIAAADDEATRKRWLFVAVAINLGVLCFFKYFGFFVESAHDFTAMAGLELPKQVLQIVLPVGISFYTFHAISYAVDVFRGRVEVERSPVTFGLFIAYFPLLMAGPIERAWHLLPQLRRERRPPDFERAYSAIVLIVLGLVKKVVLGDAVAPIANRMFDNPSGRGALPLAMGAVAFAIQIYGDFSGYSDIARGTSRLLGIEVFRNFEQPYLSRNITQFWRTWHISLSNWLHDYLYVPLGGNRDGKLATYRNLFLTMLLGGLWHGASWTFVIWGGLHGIALAAHRATGHYEGRGTPASPRWRDLPAIVGTFALVTGLWVFFRASSLENALTYLGGMLAAPLGPNAGAWRGELVVLLAVAAGVLAIDLVDRNRVRLRPLARWAPSVQGAMCGVAVVALLVWSGRPPQPFIYFQF
jgi:D-alanyl-lipoteichoic acid acyltransferase DltB (MBOAT superfamily)